MTRLSDEQEREFEKQVLEELRGISSLAELQQLVGEISPEEQARLRTLWDEPITEEELRFLGPDFDERIKNRLEEHLKSLRQNNATAE